MKTIYFLLLIPGFVLSQNVLAESSKSINPLLISETIPKSIVYSVDSMAIETPKIFKNKKTVLLFYRGGWCPYCNQHLSEISSIENKIIEMNYQIIAISPDSPSHIKKTINKEHLNYTIYSDSSGDFIKKMGIAYEAPLLYKPIIKNSSLGVNNSFLPVPSLYILDENQAIVFEYISPDYKNRISSELLLAVLNVLNKK